MKYKKRAHSGFKRIQLYPKIELPGYIPEEKRKLNAWVPVNLYSKLESAWYDNIPRHS